MNGQEKSYENVCEVKEGCAKAMKFIQEMEHHEKRFTRIGKEKQLLHVDTCPDFEIRHWRWNDGETGKVYFWDTRHEFVHKDPRKEVQE